MKSDDIRLVVVGTSFRLVGFEGLSRFVLGPEQRAELIALRAALGGVEVVQLSTCNRAECYVAPPPGGEPLDAQALAARVAGVFGARPEELYAYSGARAAEHLFSVASSLDSLVLGEFEIAGQVRRALERARALEIDGPYLRRIFERASLVARRVRSETAIGRTPVSVASLCARRVREHLADLGRVPRVAIAGAGEAARKTTAALARSGARLLLVNRTVARAGALAAEHGGEAVALDAFLAAPPADLDAIVCATAASSVIVPAGALEPALRARAAEGRRLLACDLGVPANVDPALGRDPRARRIALADIEAEARENRARLDGDVETARAIVAEEARRLAREERLRALAVESVERLLARRLGHLAPADRDTLRGFAAALAARLARQP